MSCFSEQDESQIGLLVAQYLQAVEPHNLLIPPGDVLLKPETQQRIYREMFCESIVWPIPPEKYRARILKLLLLRIESSIVDPEEDVCLLFMPQ